MHDLLNCLTLNIVEKTKAYKIFFNLLFWGLYSFGFYQLDKSYGNNNILPYNQIITITTQVFLVYFINYFIFRRYYERGKQVEFFLYSLLLILYLIPVFRLVAMIVFKINVTFSRLFNEGLLVLYIVTCVLVFISISIRLLKKRDKEKWERNEIENQKREIELFALKNQIDSHFLFNTLNNIYGLTLKKSDLAPKSVLLLSEILSFVLYETKKDYYPLNSEIHLINSYIELERMRWGDEINVNFEVSGNISNIFITPLILFTFVENSFKHGIAKTPDNPWIRIKISKGVSEVFFEIENSLPAMKEDNSQRRIDGIGLVNIKRRLNLLYPNNHYLVSRVDETSFYVGLTLSTN